MEIRRILQGDSTGFSVPRPVEKKEAGTAEAVRPAADRVELSRQWTEQMEEQNAQLRALLSQPAGQSGEKKSEGILGLLDGADAGKEELDGLSQQLKTKQKCLEIAMRIMKGKKVPPQDERYLMENDPEGYKLAMAMRKPPKKDEKECKSVLDEEDKNGGTSETSTGEEPAEASSGSEEVE